MAFIWDEVIFDIAHDSTTICGALLIISGCFMTLFARRINEMLPTTTCCSGGGGRKGTTTTTTTPTQVTTTTPNAAATTSTTTAVADITSTSYDDEGEEGAEVKTDVANSP